MIDIHDRVFVAQMVRANYLFNWAYDQAAGLAIVDQYGGRATRVDWRKELPAEVNWFICETPAALFLFCGGINDDQGRAQIIGGWGNINAIEADNGFNHWAWTFVKRWETTWPVFKNWKEKQVIFVGQSGGGLAVQAANFLNFGKDIRRNDVMILTGTPRALSHNYRGFYSEAETYRFMMVNDPVVALPPRETEWPELCHLYARLPVPLTILGIIQGAEITSNNPVYQMWPLFHHPKGGIVLTEDGYSYARNDLPPPRSTTPLIGGAIESVARLFSYQAHEMMTYVAATALWAANSAGITGTTGPETPGETSSGNWGPDIQFFCPADDFGNIVASPNGRVQVANSIVQTGTVPLSNGDLGGSLYLRGQLVATFPTRSRAKTAATRLNRFLAKLPTATEVSTSGLSDGMLQYLSEAAVGGGVDRRPVKVVT